MSSGRREEEHTCPRPEVVSRSWMSDVESDWSPIHDAAFTGRLLALQRLISQGTSVNLRTLDRVSPLHGACVRGHLGCAETLVQNGADVNLSTVDGATPLSEACSRGHAALASLLLRRGADPRGGARSHSPIHRAAAEGRPECLEPLVEHGADLDQVVEQQGSPLHVACSNQHLSTVRKLLELGACVNSSVRGEAPLHVAARLSSAELASALLDHGAAPSLRNWEGKRPLDLAPPDSPVARLLRRGEVPSLMQLCRLHIRRTLGNTRLRGIDHLCLPADVKRYLLYTRGRAVPAAATRGRACTSIAEDVDLRRVFESRFTCK